MLAVSVYIARYLRRDSQKTGETITAIREQIADLPSGKRILIEARSSGEPLLLAYALRPRISLVTLEGYLTQADAMRALSEFEPVFLICRPESDLLKVGEWVSIPLDLPAPYDDFEAYASTLTVN
jgi:hypothetical protein